MIPEWAKGAIFYQIFPDRFCNGDRENDVKTDEYSYTPGGGVRRVEDWNSLPQEVDVHRFFGGDLQGVWDKLDYLKELGVEVILFNPIFRSRSNHKYDTTDYYCIDPHLASKRAPGQTQDRDLTPNEYFAYFVRAVHDAGMKLVLDGVFNHCGIDSAWTADPERAEYFTREANGGFESWWGVETLPKLNYDGSRRLWNEILEAAEFWVSEPYCCDGWRLDVAADLGHTPQTNHAFWKEFITRVKSANPDAIVFAEHYGNPREWLADGEWDSVMNYDGFMDPVSGFFTGVDKHCDYECGELLANAEAFAESLRLGREGFPSEDSYLAAINQLDNHDHARYITRTAGRAGRLATKGSEDASRGVRYDVLLSSVVFQMTWPGAPTLYYGDETAVPGWTDPDNRRTYPWGHENYEIIDFYKNIIRLHKSSEALRTGECSVLQSSDGVFAFCRKKNDEQYIIVINRSESEKEFALNLAEHGLFTGDAVRVFSTADGYSVGSKEIKLLSGVLKTKLKPVSSKVIKLIKG